MLKTDLRKKVKETDEILNKAIQEYLDGKHYRGDPTTIAQWRLANYEDLRRWSYPPITEYLDAQLKVRDKLAINKKNEGTAQIETYDDKCWAVKYRFPKE